MKLKTEPIKNWFGFTRRERRSSFILLILLFLILILRITIPGKSIVVQDMTANFSDVAGQSGSNNSENQNSVQLFSFDPNTVTYDTLIRLGFEDRQAKTLIAYRNSGGKFRKPSDLGKVYGLEDVKTKELLPFVKIKANTAGKSIIFSKIPQKDLIDLNRCDSAQLVSLPGIGPVLSARIIRYRNLLGGYAHIEQLKEVYGLPPETYEIIKGRVIADSSAITGIEINTAGYKELSRLPYLKNYEITSILKYRELKGRISGMEDLTDNNLLTHEKADKVRPYLNFR
jgi:competence protein ComEA